MGRLTETSIRFILACATFAAIAYWPEFAVLPALIWGVSIGHREARAALEASDEQ